MDDKADSLRPLIPDDVWSNESLCVMRAKHMHRELSALFERFPDFQIKEQVVSSDSRSFRVRRSAASVATHCFMQLQKTHQRFARTPNSCLRLCVGALPIDICFVMQ